MVSFKNGHTNSLISVINCKKSNHPYTLNYKWVCHCVPVLSKVIELLECWNSAIPDHNALAGKQISVKCI